MASHGERTKLISDALKMAVSVPGGVTTGIIFHSDRGSQGDFRQLVGDLEMRQSVGRAGALGQLSG